MRLAFGALVLAACVDGPTLEVDDVGLGTSFELAAAPGQEARIERFRPYRDRMGGFARAIGGPTPSGRTVRLYFAHAPSHYGVVGETPPPWREDIPRADLLASLYGPDFVATAQTLRERVAQARTAAEWEELLTDIACAFPALRGGIAELPELARSLPMDVVRGWAEMVLGRLVDPDAPAADVSEVFGRAPGIATAYSTRAGRACPLIVFYRYQIASGAILEGEGLEDVRLHELAHVLEHASRRNRRVADDALSEALADVLSHLYMGTSCVRDGYQDGCRRDLSAPPPDTARDRAASAAWKSHGGRFGADVIADLLMARDQALEGLESDPQIFLLANEQAPLRGPEFDAAGTEASRAAGDAALADRFAALVSTP